MINKSKQPKIALVGLIILLLLPINSNAQKIRLSKSLILEQKNSLNTNYSYKNQHSYFNAINNNNIDHDSENIYLELNSSLKITKKYQKTQKIGLFVNAKSNFSNKIDKNDKFYSYLDKSYFFTEQKFGKLEFGRNIPINKKMAISTYNFARGSGGVSGGYMQYLNLPILRNDNLIASCSGFKNNNNIIIENGDCSKIKLPKFILLPTSPISHGGNAVGLYHNIFDNNYNNSDSNLIGFGNNNSNNRVNSDNSLGNLQNSLKLNYYSKRINAFQAGLGYTLNAKNDSILDPNHDIKSHLGQIYSWGLNYSNYFENIGFGASITGEYGKIGNIYNQDNLNSYEIGLMLTYFGFTIGGSYGNWGNSLNPKIGIYSCNYNQSLTLVNQDCSLSSNKFSDSYYLNAGISYEFGPFGISFTYLKSNFQENIYQASVFSLDYKLKKSLKSYLELAKFDFNSNHAKFFDGYNVINQESLSLEQRQIADNSGYIILMGILFKF